MWRLLAAVLISVASGVAFRALAALGFGLITYTGIGYLFDNIRDYVHGLFGGVPLPVAQILGLAKVDIAINIVLAALAARLLIAGMGKVAGTLTAFSYISK